MATPVSALVEREGASSSVSEKLNNPSPLRVPTPEQPPQSPGQANSWGAQPLLPLEKGATPHARSGTAGGRGLIGNDIATVFSDLFQ